MRPAALALPLAAVLAACSADGVKGGDRAPETPSASPASFAVRVDVIPSNVRGDGGDVRVLPQSTELQLEGGEAGVTVEPIVLREPLPLSGTVVGYAVNPFSAELPGQQVPVRALVSLRGAGSLADAGLHSFTTSSDERGRFEAWVLPALDYTLSIVPEDPGLPTWFGPLRTTGELGQLDLGSGTPIYGLVDDGTDPLAGVGVHAENALGQRTATTFTDAGGFYQLRVWPGTWTVVCEGRPLGLDPELATEPLEVGESGVLGSFRLRPVDERVLVEGAVRTPAGDVVPGTVLRFTSTSLVGYTDGPAASYRADGTVNSDGRYLVRLVPGTYDVEVLPPANDDGSSDHGPRALSGVVATEDGVLDVETTRLRELRGLVRDEARKPVAGARLTCEEQGFDGHTFTTFTTDQGRYLAVLPPVPLACELAPPGDRTDLALTRFALDGARAVDRDLSLEVGVEVRGEVRFADADGEPEPGAVVEVHDAVTDRLLGFDLTDEDGTWSVRLDPDDGAVAD